MTVVTDKKFRDAESMWFWFCYSISVRRGARATDTDSRRACGLMDVYALLSNLLREKKINSQHIMVLKEFGDHRRAPTLHIWSESRKYKLWIEAIQAIGEAAVAKGWVESV